MNKTQIEYLTHTWNPIAMRCSPVSDGCDNCWHLRMCKRHAGNGNLSPDVRAAKAGGSPVLLAGELEAPLRRREPARIGVQFMGDLFHEDVPEGFIHSVAKAMAHAPQHTFQVLTKRPKRMACVWPRIRSCLPDRLEHVQLGASVENQAVADERIPHLMRCPAAVGLLSLEPLLGEVDLTWTGSDDVSYGRYNCLNGDCAETEMTGGKPWDWIQKCGTQPVSWVIVGGESGPGARPCKPDWVRSIRDQCAAAGVPFFFKGWGEWLHESQFVIGMDWVALVTHTVYEWPDGTKSYRVGKKKAGSRLDGKRHREWPEVTNA